MIRRRMATAALFFALLSCPSLARALEVDFVAITAGSNRDDGTLVDYFLSFSLEGTDIASARVLEPGLPPTEICVLVQEGDNDWNCDLLGFASLDDICNNIGFGDFLFELTASVGSDDTLTVFFDPGCTDPFPGYPLITAPLPGGVVPPVPGPDDFCWDCSASGSCGPGDTVVSLFDVGDTDLVVELLRDVSTPACWDPRVCIPTGPDDEFEVSALTIYSDFETRFTDLGDDFTYVSAFESQNSTLYDVIDPVPTTPPAVPAGLGASGALLAEKLNPGATSIALEWDAESCCGITDHHLVYGTGADLPAAAGGDFTPDGGVCALGGSGTFTWNGVPAPAPGDFLWWIVLANDAATVEGSWGEDSSGNERSGPGTGGASGECGITAKSLANACGL